MRTALKKIVVTALAVAMMITAFTFFIPVNRAEAGSSKSYVLSQATIDGETINSGDLMVEGGVYGKNDKIVFDSTKVKENSYITATTIINNLRNSGVEMLFTSSFDVSINSFAKSQNSEISFMFGINSIRNVRNGRDCFKVIFTENADGGIDVEIVEVPEDKTAAENVVVEKRRATTLIYGESFNLTVNADTDRNISLSIDGINVLKNYKTSIDPTGYFSVYSAGKNDFTLSNMEMIAHTYIVAENCDYVETFDNGEYNANIFYSESIALNYTPSRLSVNEEVGALEFLNTHEAYISTIYQYSNFELEFDLFDLVSDEVKDENGTVIKPVSSRIGIGIGENYKTTVPSMEHNDTWLLMWGDRPSGSCYKMLDNFVDRCDPKSMSEFDLWDSEFIKGRKVNVKYSSLDGYVQLFLKFDGEYPYKETDKEYDAKEKEYYDYKCYFDCDVGKSNKGHIKIFSYGTVNYKIDNLSIRNTDYESVRQTLTKEEVGFKTNKRPKTPDFDYENRTDDDDLLKNSIAKEDAEGSCSATFTESIVAPVVAVVVMAVAVYVRRKRA